jgi:hypothetical protein
MACSHCLALIVRCILFFHHWREMTHESRPDKFNIEPLTVSKVSLYSLASERLCFRESSSHLIGTMLVIRYCRLG